jgi:predicted extracellular nuclease
MNKRISFFAGAAVCAAAFFQSGATPSAVSTSIVISQVYGGGGNAGATLKNDFIELYNRGAAPQSLSGWSVQYASAAGTTWQVTNLTALTLQPGQYYLVQEAAGAGGTVNLPTPDAIGTIAMSAAAGKVALVNTTTALSGSGCPQPASVVDFVGYGAANCSEGTPTAATANTTAAIRKNDGATDTDNNLADFIVAPPNPRNSVPTPPTGIGSTSPAAVSPGQSILLVVGVTPGTNPTSTNLAVIVDLSALGGGSVQMFDDGSNGDLVAGDSTFSLLFATPVNAAVQAYAVPFTVSDVQGRSSSGMLNITLQVNPPQDVLISQVYGGGGNAGAFYTNDFIELFNRGTQPMPLSGSSLQYQSATGAGTWQVTALSGIIPPGHYFLVQEGQGTGGSAPLPAPDVVAAAPAIAMAAGAGKVVLASTTTAFVGACPGAAQTIDLVGYGSTATCFEGTAPAPAPSATRSIARAAGGCVDTNNNGSDFLAGAVIPRNSSVAGDCTNPGGLALAIHDIQGPGVASPYVDQRVTTDGIVTGRKSNGFFLQTPDALADTDPATSEGVFVFTGSAVPAAAVVGNDVSVTGTVQEFQPAAGSPTTTEITGPTVAVLSTGNPLPAAIDLNGAPTASGDFYQLERYEGMRVHIASLTVVEGTGGRVDEANATSTSFGDFYGVITGTAFPFREPGIELPTVPPSPPCCIAQFDGNPERLRIDSASLGGQRLEVGRGAVLTNIVGPVDFNFSAYSVNLDPAAVVEVTGAAVTFTAVPAPAPREFTVAAFNMEHFFDTVDDPDTPFDVALAPAALANRLNKASLAIRNVLRTPDILAVEEVEHLATLQALADKISADAIAAGQSDPQYQAILYEGNDPSGIDSGFLVKHGRVEIVSAVQFGKDTTFVNPSNATELLNDRPPVVLHAIVKVPGTADVPITVIVNHLKSLIGVETLDATGARNRAKRAAQAEFLANLIQPLQAAGERVVAVGDFNAFQFNDGYVDVIGTIEGNPAPADHVLTPTTPQLVSPTLLDLVDQTPADRRFSYSFNGNLQALDHALMTQNLLSLAPHLEFGRMDAGFPESYRGDPTRPERLSDHDPIVAYFTAPQATQIVYTGPSSVEAAGALTPVTLQALLTDVPGGNAVSGEQVTFTLGTTTLAAVTDAGGVATAIANLPPGSHSVTVAFAGDPDRHLLGSSIHASLTIADTTPPVIGGVTASTSSLWPPNGRMVSVAIATSAADRVDTAPACGVASVTSNEGTSADWEIAGSSSVKLRAARAGSGTGRVYTITVRCADASGNVANASTFVTVPHDQGK